MTEYLHHIKWYLKERFDLSADIFAYNSTAIDIHDKYRIIIFVQHIEPTILHNIQEENDAQERNIFLLNTEQATMSNYMNKTMKEIQQYKVPVIDYSMENIALLQKRFPGTTFIHFPFPITVKPLVQKTNLAISLQSSPHREKVCNSLNIPVTNFHDKWGDQRDNLIKSSKVLVNVHYNPEEYGIFESIRCYHALEMRTLVISEYSMSRNKVLLQDFIIFANEEQMPEKIKDVLENYQSYYDQCFSDDRLREIDQRFERVYRKSIDEMMNIHNDGEMVANHYKEHWWGE